ncbi:unnamed protein product [Brassica rapa]|uniref:Reverse transcriptase zinc-binding domain-containing protein n=1 Tax=Brassica campestris TaxID=3711 RepID=A0A8D9M4Z7_BRACM|nr:unnamed protein product [Brassica rapa]
MRSGLFHLDTTKNTDIFSKVRLLLSTNSKDPIDNYILGITKLELAKYVWSPKLLPKVNMFIWRCALNNLPTRENLRKDVYPLDPLACSSFRTTLQFSLT